MDMKFTGLEECGIMEALPEPMKGIFLPDGIFYWSDRAAKEAEINATIGSAKGKASHFLPGGGDSIKTFYLPSIIDALKGLNSEQVVSYAKIAGMPNFRQAWRKWVVQKLEKHYKFDENLLGLPIVLPGATAGITYLARFFLSPGDSIICHDRHWENYDLIYEGCQGLKVETVPLFNGNGMEIEALAEKVVELGARQKCVAAVLNFPNNPTGYMPTVKEGKALRDALVAAANKSDARIVLIFDDAYEGYVYEDDAAPVSIFGDFIGAHPGIIPVKCDGATKEFLIYGGRVAAVTFAAHPQWGDVKRIHSEIENKMKALIRGSISNCNRATQEAVALALGNMDVVSAERKKIVDVLAERYRILKQELGGTDMPGCSTDPFNAGFFCSLNVPVPAEELSDRLLKKYKVGTIPMNIERLGINSIRIAFCSVEADTIGEMVSRISDCIRTF